MDIIENLADAANVTYAELCMELYIDPDVHSELFQRIYNETLFDKKISNAFYSFMASFPEIDNMVYPIYYCGEMITSHDSLDNNVIEYHRIGKDYFIIENVGNKEELIDTSSASLYISKKCSFKQTENVIEYSDSIIDFSKSLVDAREKMERSALTNVVSGKRLKEDYIKCLIRDTKRYFPDSNISYKNVIDFMSEQKVYAI